jgi:serine/threonine protein phosphatase PrpC
MYVVYAQWLLLGTDGLFDVFMSKDELIGFATRWLESHSRASLCVAVSAGAFSAHFDRRVLQLVDEALRRNSKDNISAMIVFFAHDRK